MIESPDPFEKWLAQQRETRLPPGPGTFDRITRAAGRRRRAKAAGISLLSLVAVTSGVIATSWYLPGAGDTRGVPPGSTGTGAYPSASVGRTSPPPSMTGAPNVTSPPPSIPASGDSSASATDGGGRCHSGALSLATGSDPAGDGAGHTGVMLIFTNTSAQTCTMYGYPGVSFTTGASGQQINDPAQRNRNLTPSPVTLPSHASAHANIRLSQPGNYDPGTCQPVQAAGFRVYPPDETTALFVASPVEACSGKGVAVPEVSPVQPGGSGS